MRPRFHTFNGSGRFPQRRRVRAVSQKDTVQGFFLYLILCFGLGLSLGLVLGLGLNPGFGLSLGVGLGTGLSIRLGRDLDMPQVASLNTVDQESDGNIAVEDASAGSVINVVEENLEEISDVRAMRCKYDNWKDVHKNTGDKTVKEGAEGGQGNYQT